MATIAENLQTILDIKNDIKDAIIAKGVSVADSDGFATYPSKIESIETGGSGTTNTIDVAAAGIKFGYSNFTELPDYYDFSGVEDFSYMFQGCSKLTSIPNSINSNITDMYRTFYDCQNLTAIPQLNTSFVNNMGYAFTNCYRLTSIPLLDTSNVNNLTYAFSICAALTTIPQLNTSNVDNVSYMFNGCTSLQSLPLLDFGNVTKISWFFGYSDITTLTDLGGFENLKISWSDGYGLNRLPNLTYESVMNVINNLYDFRGNGDTTSTRTIKFNANSIALLSDEDIAIATNKGWTIYS